MAGIVITRAALRGGLSTSAQEKSSRTQSVLADHTIMLLCPPTITTNCRSARSLCVTPDRSGNSAFRNTGRIPAARSSRWTRIGAGNPTKNCRKNFKIFYVGGLGPWKTHPEVSSRTYPPGGGLSPPGICYHPATKPSRITRYYAVIGIVRK
jgi:hypothetical protein